MVRHSHWQIAAALTFTHDISALFDRAQKLVV
jgi:hypothetical protein